MATFRKRGNSWTAEVCVNGRRKSKSFSIKAKARDWALKMELEYGKLNEEGVSEYMTLHGLFERYAEEVSEDKKGARWEMIRLNRFMRDDIAGLKLVDIKRQHVQSWIDRRLVEVKPSSVNRELNLMSHCFTQARRWSLMSHNPMADIKRPKNPPHRDRRITQQEIDTILASLNYSEDWPVVQSQQCVAVAFLVAIETAMRAGEICGIASDHFDKLKRTIYLPETKGGNPRYVPLSKEAFRLLSRLPKQEDGAPIFGLKSGSLSTVFKKAVTRADIQNLTFHDTRHEAITRLAKKIDVLDLARMVGHRDVKQLMTYYNKRAEELVCELD